VRYLFAGTRPNTEFAISFDLDVIKIYEDYDRTERIFWGTEAAKDEDTRLRERRIYELSQVEGLPAKMPLQVAFRHLTSLLLIYQGDVDRVIANLPGVEAWQEAGVRARAERAWYWVNECAPEDFRFAVRDDEDPIETRPNEAAALRALRDIARELALNGPKDEKELSTAIFSAAKDNGLEPKDFFKLVYRALIGKDQGPRLAGFVLTLGGDRVAKILAAY
jgi:lysyl-tRNA synthetase class 1